MSTWLRETDSVFGFYFVLACHTLGLEMLVGLNAAVDLLLLNAIKTTSSARCLTAYHRSALKFNLGVVDEILADPKLEV